jgi:hypothetical protein
MFQLKHYTEAVEIAYPKLRDYIIGDLSDEEYIHIIQLATSVLLNRDGILPGGHFVQSICNNNLKDAVNRADSTAIKGIKFFVYCYNNLHPSNQISSICIV